MDPQYLPYVWLGASLLGAVLLDFVVVRILLDLVRPTTAYVFWIGRAGKLVALLGWCVFFNRFWYPTYLGQGAAAPPMLGAIEWAVAGIMILLAATSLPRGFAGKGTPDA